jgi:hypothetical protein
MRDCAEIATIVRRRRVDDGGWHDPGDARVDWQCDLFHVHLCAAGLYDDAVDRLDVCREIIGAPDSIRRVLAH